MHDVFVHPSGQDDNLGDSALRAGLLQALRGEGNRLHVYLDGQSSDYLSGIPLETRDILYTSRQAWLQASREVNRPVYVINAGEINPQPGVSFPGGKRIAEMRGVVNRGGIVVAAGLGLKDPTVAPKVVFDPKLREAAVMSWRDHGSRQGAGFGDVAPDWAFSLGPDPSAWPGKDSRRLIAVTLRFDRPWPGERWLAAVRTLAARTATRVVTIAQVARDAPRAVRLAGELQGEYLVAPTTRHDHLDAHVRAVYSRSLAVVSDRAHALIMGATEGAYPVGTAADPQKIRRLLDTVGIGALTGHHDGLAERAQNLELEVAGLESAIEAARRDLGLLTQRLNSAIDTAT
ncbi:polysaccharide pyruvyl transferase family protein [Microbacterium protaetiae]|uniref:polysaccharide pyruvyl transferase family protein n=1 Tax=Microbacterium protaetiae TaxID=2509458 RepID=UPI001F5DD758|nr:polysaccharide pyruvyl transferase family protein [Microbacterium protaetiae]